MKKIVFCIGMSILLVMAPFLKTHADAGTVQIDLMDGIYDIDVMLEGGTGRATIVSPASLFVRDGRAYARIEWSSSNYDYMLVDGEKYFPMNENGNSVFEIPILVFDAPMKVIADTTAMSTPHEIDYTLMFDSKTISGENDTLQDAFPGLIFGITIVIIAMVTVGIFVFVKKMKHNGDTDV